MPEPRGTTASARAPCGGPRSTRCCTPRRRAAGSPYGTGNGWSAPRPWTAPHGRKVVASFADGSRAEGDFLVGADGLHSVTRTLIDPAAPSPRYTGQNTVCGYVRDAGIPLAPDTYTMIFGKRAFFGCTVDPGGEVWWFANIPGTELDRADPPAVTPAAWRERVAGLFDGDDTPAAALVRATGDRVIVSNAYDLASTPTWHTDTMVVLGDAAHAAAPNAAQGASMAIEDGIVLAKCLRDRPDPGSAFAAYEELRRERVEKVVAASAGMAKLAGPGAPAARPARTLPGAGLPSAAVASVAVPGVTVPVGTTG